MAGFSPSSSAALLHGLLLIFMVDLSANGDEGTAWSRTTGLMDTRREIPFAVQNAEGNLIQKVVDDECPNIKRHDFPEDFIFGAGTAALEIEGATVLDGRGPSIWEIYIEQYPDRIKDGSNLCVAIDSYRRYKEDVQRLVQLGVKYYRFSISWTRILPRGSLSGGVNKKGIEHYRNLINELCNNGIKPVATLLHFDVPQALQERYEGFLSPKIVDDFKDYANICFTAFGDRVHQWVTINEPYVMALGYTYGTAPPGRCSPPACPAGNSSTEPYRVIHNVLLAHATVYRLYQTKFKATQKGQLGMSHVGQYAVPYDTNATEDIDAARRVLDFMLGCFVEPLVYGRYPKSMQDLVKDRLVPFSDAEKKLLIGAMDFVGINYYTSRFAKNDDSIDVPPSYGTDYLAELLTVNASGDPIGRQSTGNEVIYIYPKGLQQLVEFMKETYDHPNIFVTENGIADPTNVPLYELMLHDKERICYIKSHLHYLHEAIKNGTKVKGYFYWNVFDDFEWGDGYQSRFGFFYVDHENNLTRVAKKSSKWYKSFLNGAGDGDDDNDNWWLLSA